MRILPILFVLAATLGGCAESGEPVQVADDHAHDDHAHDHNETIEALTGALSLDIVNGTSPLLVNFTVDGNAPNATWAITFGDGNMTNGTGLPAMANHTYVQIGNFSAVLDLVDGNQTFTISQNITVNEIVEAAPSLPEQMHFEFADSLGCAGDFLQIGGLDCFSFTEGPSASGIDGYWVELSPLYWGLPFVTTVDNVLGDSDCAVTDVDFNVLERPNGSSGPCAGTFPEDGAWMFIYSYAEFAMSQTLTFSEA